MCDTVPPFEALTYLKTQLAEIVDQEDEDEAADLRGLLSYLLSKTTNGDSRLNGHSVSGTQSEDSERSKRRDLFDFLIQFVAPDEREPCTELRDLVENV